jgi:CMP-N-acetylneuraminic acid synthetase
MSIEEVLAIIPARGGSKGIPRKNLRPFGGMPLLGHTVLQSRAAVSINRTVVSTEDNEIASVARAFGAEVVKRPPELSGDRASTESALLHVLDFLEVTERYSPDLVVLLQCTSPLRQPGDIDAAVETLRSEGADSLFSAAPINGFVWRITGQGPRSVSYDFRQRPRRQDADQDVVENGSIYVFRPSVLRREGNRLGGKIAVYSMNPLDSFQLDDEADWRLLEALLPLPCARLRGSPAPPIALLVSDFDGVMTDNRVLVSENGNSKGSYQFPAINCLN